MGDTSEESQSSPTDRDDVLLPLVRKLTESSTIDQMLENVSHAVLELAALEANDLPEDLLQGILQLVRNPHSSAAALNALQAVVTIVSRPCNQQSKKRIISDVMPSVFTILKTPDDKEKVGVCCEILYRIIGLENVSRIKMVERDDILDNLLTLLRNSGEIDRETRILAVRPITQLADRASRNLLRNLLNKGCIWLVCDLLETTPPLHPGMVTYCSNCLTNIFKAAKNKKISLNDYIPDGCLETIKKLHVTYQEAIHCLSACIELLE